MTDCYSCESDVTKCDACSGGKAYDEKSGNCASKSVLMCSYQSMMDFWCHIGSAGIDCMECDDCDGLLGGLIFLAAVLLMVFVAVAVAIPLFFILGKKKSAKNAVSPVKDVDEKLVESS